MRFSVSFPVRSSEDEDLRRAYLLMFATRAGSQPVDRDFGISWEYLDRPPEVVESMIVLEIEEKTERYFPEIEIRQIQVSMGIDGGMGVFVSCGRKN